LKLLLDTHAYVWWLSDNPKLSAAAKTAISSEEARVFVSAATVWELAIKTRLGKITLDGDPVAEIEANGFFELPITARHAQQAGGLPRHHEDPFDRMLIAQAQSEGLTLVSRDEVFESYEVPLLWNK
jgi:PIN domain nuclease of toxin-antitoxin system